AQDRNLDYVLAMDPDRLLAPYLVESGLEPKADNYGNWEDRGLDGHIGGHYLTALSLAWAATGRQDVLKRLDYMLSELKRAQDANGNGYLGGVPGSDELWKQIAAGDVRADLFSLNGSWVPWYNLHKTYAGLRDAYLHAGIDEARTMLIDLTDWSLQLVNGLTDEQIQTMLRTEHGGLNEVFADVAAITGDATYLELAHRFSHRLILDPLLEQEDRLTGLHANTQIPKVIGYQRVADVADSFGQTGFEAWHDAASFFWDTVVNTRTVAIGGNSVREHFHPTDDFTSMVTEPEGPETCNTYNMLRLTRMLFLAKPSGQYVDYYERALYNHILASQHPEHGGLVYFTPMRPGHYRVYSQPDKAMWCCVGSGIENHAKYGEFIYAHRGDELYVNLFIPSTLNWNEQNVRLEQRTQFPDGETTVLTVQSAASFMMKLRYPSWVRTGEMAVTINGVPQPIDAQPGDYISLDRSWQTGDEVSVTLPMHTRLEQMPDQSDYYAVLHGPIVLAAKMDPFEDEQLGFLADDSRMGHVASGPLCPPEKTPIFVSATDDFASKIEPVEGQPLTFKAPDLIEDTDRNLQLIPFFRLHDARYIVYWPHTTPEGLEERRRAWSATEQARLALEARTIDRVVPGEQQPEAEHAFKGESTEAGVHRGRHWRHARGWFSYDLTDPAQEAATLRITYSGEDRNRHFDILMNGIKVATVELDGSQGDFYSVDYPIPATALEKAVNGTLATRFEAHPGSMAGGIYDVRLLRAKDDNK
ncbi:MAG TPA: glycoside hydrolase family 127 protein, partial [Rhodothermales bacterium]|nr:glycoside hydrolase family 127 protein [Rhodothermales bacterium]